MQNIKNKILITALLNSISSSQRDIFTLCLTYYREFQILLTIFSIHFPFMEKAID